MGTNVDNQTFLEGKRLSASGAHMGTVSTMDAAMLGEHGLGEETGSTLADEGTVTCMKAGMLCQLAFLTERAITNCTGKRSDPEVTQLMLRQLNLLHKGFTTRSTGKRTLTRMKLMVHAKRQSC